MLERNKTLQMILLLIILAFVLGACQSSGTPEKIVETVVITKMVEATPVEVIRVVTPIAEPSGPRTLVICLGVEPETLNPVGIRSAAAGPIFEAIYEGVNWGPFDSNMFAFQPIILEKLPSLDDGDAALTVVSVSEGDQVVDVDSNVVTLDPAADPPLMLVPAGGGDPVPYQGGDFAMDQLSANFTLLPNLLWSDGTPLTASDSVYTFNLRADPNNLSPNFYIERTASYEASDDLTIEWAGMPGFLDDGYYTSFFGPVPEHLLGEFSTTELFGSQEFVNTPIGWGPYIIDEWKQGDSMTLHKNPNYFRAEEGLPKFDTLVFRFVGKDSNANIASILSGECDIVDQTAGLFDQSELLIELEAADQINVTFTTDTWWEHIDFGIQHVEYDDGYQMGIDRPDFFSDVRTRRAFAMCMDRQALIDTIWLEQSFVIDSYLQPQHPMYNADVQQYNFDVEAGSALLEDVGWVDDDSDPETPRMAQGVANVPDGTRLEVAYETTNTVQRQNIADFIQASLAQCGIQVDLQFYDPGDLFVESPEGVLFGRQFDLGQFAWRTGIKSPCDLYQSNLTPGPAGEEWTSILDGTTRTFSINGWFAQNNTGFADEEYDRACNIAMGSLPGQPEYETAHLEAQRIFAEQLPVVPLFPRIKLAATRPDMCGFIMNPTANNEFWNIEEFDYGEGCDE